MRLKMAEVGREITPSMHEELGLMLEEAGAMSLKDFARVPIATKDKVMRCLAILQILPEQDFSAAEVKAVMKEQLGIGDYQRYILMLVQGGFLSRMPSGAGRLFLHSKTEAARLPEPKLAKALLDANPKMYGYEQKRPGPRITGGNSAFREMERLEGGSQLLNQKQPDAWTEDDVASSLEQNEDKAVLKLKYQLKRLQAENELLKQQLDQARRDYPALAKLSEEFLELEKSFEKARIAFPTMNLEMFLEFWLKTRKGIGR
jgi:hypothetical protein